MDGADDDGWSSVATEWAELWGEHAEPVHRAIVESTGIRWGSRVLDVGCGSGEFLCLLESLGTLPSGIDPAPAMVNLSRKTAPYADVREGEVEALPWGDGAFDVVTAINSLQFADDPAAGLAELVRVTTPGGFVAVSNWAEGALNDLDVIERAIAAHHGDEPTPDGELRPAGGLERLFESAGLRVATSRLIELQWDLADDASLVRGVMLGEDDSTMDAATPAVLAAAAPFRLVGGGYRLVNRFRLVVSRVR